MDKEISAIHAIVSGRVQGVWYRASAQKKAQTLGLTGWVKNTDGGDVEVLACGEKSKLDALINWLWQGPPLAKVKDVSVSDCGVEHFESFSVL